MHSIYKRCLICFGLPAFATNRKRLQVWRPLNFKCPKCARAPRLLSFVVAQAPEDWKTL